MELKDVSTTGLAVNYINSLNETQKAMLCSLAIKRQERIEKENEILKPMYANGRGYHVLGIVGPYAIIEANNKMDDFPFTSAFYNEEKWVLTHRFWENMELALFCAMGYKEEGSNSKFDRYAYNMLFGGEL